MKHPIKCFKCGEKKVGEIELNQSSDYKGDEYYGYLCDDCVKDYVPPALTRQEILKLKEFIKTLPEK